VRKIPPKTFLENKTKSRIGLHPMDWIAEKLMSTDE